jgi:hypothetical protein
MAQDLFSAFMNGWNFVEDIKDRQTRRQELDLLRSRRQTEWGREDEKYQEAKRLEHLQELGRRFDSVALNPDGTYKSFEQIRTDGNGRALIDLWNDPLFNGARNVPGKDVKIVNAYGRGDKMMLEAEWRDPSSGEVVSRGPLTANRSRDPNDPVRELSISEIGKRLTTELQAGDAAFAKKWQAGRAGAATMDAIDKLYGGGEPGATPSAPGTGGGEAKYAEGRDWVYQGMLKRGVSPIHAKGMAVNAGDESGYRPDAIGDNGQSIGMFQWNGPRRDALRAYARQQGKDWTDRDVQLDYLMTEPDTKAYLSKNYTNAVDAAAAFTTEWERPKAEYAAQRVARYQKDPYLLEGGQAAAQPPVADRASREAGVMDVGNAVQPVAPAPQAPMAEAQVPLTQELINAVKNYAQVYSESLTAPSLSGSVQGKVDAARAALPNSLAKRVEAQTQQALANPSQFLQTTPAAPRAAPQLIPQAAPQVAQQPAPTAVQQAMQVAQSVPAPAGKAVGFTRPSPQQAEAVKTLLKAGVVKLEDYDRFMRTGQLSKRDVRALHDKDSYLLYDNDTGQVITTGQTSRDALSRQKDQLDLALKAGQMGAQQYETAKKRLDYRAAQTEIITGLKKDDLGFGDAFTQLSTTLDVMGLDENNPNTTAAMQLARGITKKIEAADTGSKWNPYNWFTKENRKYQSWTIGAAAAGLGLTDETQIKQGIVDPTVAVFAGSGEKPTPEEFGSAARMVAVAQKNGYSAPQATMVAQYARQTGADPMKLAQMLAQARANGRSPAEVIALMEQSLKVAAGNAQ